MKKRVLIDIDGTLCVNAMQELCEEYLGEKIDMSTLPPGVYINQKIDSPEFRKYLLEHNIYEYGKTEQDTIDFVCRLSKKYDVYIATIYYFPNIEEFSSKILPRKFEYLKKYFSFLGEEKFLFVGDKSILNFDISIGDTLSDMIGSNQNFLLTRQHNKHISKEDLKKRKAVRVSNWKEIMNILDEKESTDLLKRK